MRSQSPGNPRPRGLASRVVCTIGLLGLWMASALGCRRDPALQVYIDEINAEKRILENRLNELQFELEAKERELERYRRGARGGETNERSRRVPTLELPAPSRDRRDEDESMPDLDLSPPMIEPGEKTGRRDKPEAAPVSTPLGASRSPVARLSIDRQRTSGVNLDQIPGDDGLRVVVETLDDRGDYRPAPGEMEVELLERSTGRSLAAWEFSAEEIEVAMARSDARSGITLQMRLPREPRTSRDYELVVRYLPREGDPVTVRERLTLTPNTPKSSTWTPRRPASDASRAAAVQGASAGNPRELEPERPTGSVGASPHSATDDGSSRPAWRPYR